MKLNKLTADFGRLEGATLTPGPGLTVVQAPNEGGKSTWSAFYRAMLYGISTKERDRAGFLAEKNRFLPWSGRPMAGEVELTWKGQSITLRRSPKGANPFGKFEAVYTATGEAVPGFTGETAGELLTGVSREVFERSAFVGQGAVAVTAAPDLDSRIAALATSGEEEVSAAQVARRLKEWFNRRRANRSNGIIPRLEEELAEIDALLERQTDARLRAERAQGAVERLEPELSLLDKELSALRYRAYRAAADRRARAEEDLAAAQAEYDRLAGALSRYGTPPDNELLLQSQGELSYLTNLDGQIRAAQELLPAARQAAEEARRHAGDSLFDGQSPQEARERARRDYDRAAHQSAWRPPVGMWAVLVLAAGGAAACYALLPGLRWTAIAAAGVGIVLALLIGGLSRRAAGKRWAEERELLLKRYGGETAEDILKRAEDYAARFDAARAAEEEEHRKNEDFRNLTARREVLWTRLLTMVHTFAPEVKESFGVSAAISKIFALRDGLARSEAKLAAARAALDSLPVPGPAPQGVDETLVPRFDAAETAARRARAAEALNAAKQELAMASGERHTLGDPDELLSRREAITEELSRRQTELAAIAVAMDALDGADHAMRERFSPALNQLAGSYFARLTGGKYEDLSLDRAFGASARESGGVLPRGSLSLSAGTVDQLYLAVRLAVCALTLPADDPCPLMLDDALANFDDARCALALDTLTGLAKERQIILFTCHSREAAYLAGRPGVTVERL